MPEKPPRDLKKVWESGGFHLLRVFDKGQVMNFPKGNPYPLTKEIWETYSKDYQWLGEEKYNKLLKGLKTAFDKK